MRKKTANKFARSFFDFSTFFLFNFLTFLLCVSVVIILD